MSPATQRTRTRGVPDGGAGRGRRLLADRSGVALLMVLFVVAVLTSLVVSLTDTTQRHLHLTQYYKNRLQAYWTAQSGLQAVVALLKIDALQRAGQAGQGGHDGYTACWNCESECYQQFAPLLMSNVLCNVSMIEPALLTQAGPPAAATDETESAAPAACPILDENRKLSLFSLVENRGGRNEQTEPDVFLQLTYLLQNLLTEQDLSQEVESEGLLDDLGFEQAISFDRAETLAAYLLDWIDTPANTSTVANFDRAEDACPEDGLEYTAKNGPLDTVDELGLVCGFRTLPRHVIERLARNLTVYELTTNINTATLPVLHALCAAATGEENETDSQEIRDLLHPISADDPDARVIESEDAYEDVLAGMSPTLIDYLETFTGVQSSIFRVGFNGVVYTSDLANLESSFRLTAVLQRQTGAVPGQDLRLLYYREG